MKRSLLRPSTRGMPAGLRRAALAVAERLAAGGHRAWLVGGAVRDLALGIEPGDADLASAALPDEVEELFPRTREVGKRFGTVLVLELGMEVQVTTFRTEAGYSDARRPDVVQYGTSLEEDAARRDFTCNAIYLDPLNDELADPEAGFADLAAGILRCVGDPDRRFGEDGLRLLRLARFAARYELEVEEHTLEAARRNAGALEGVSRERIRAELERVAAGDRPARALGLLAETGVWTHFLPAPPAGIPAAVEAVSRLGPRPGLIAVLAILFAPDRAVALSELRPSREEERGVQTLWELGERLEGILEGADRRCTRVRLLREPLWPLARRVYLARFPDARGHGAALAALDEFDRRLPEDQRQPAPWLTSADLEEAGIPRGPRWGLLLREAEDRQLDGEHRDRAEALAWLREAAR